MPSCDGDRDGLGFRGHGECASRRARSAAVTWRSRAGCPGRPPPLVAASPAGNAGRRPRDARATGPQGPDPGAGGRRAPLAKSRVDGASIGMSSTSITRRLRRRTRSRHALTRSRWSQASNRSGSRRPGRSRQARMSASWTASRASSESRRIRRAAASSRARCTSMSEVKASCSPRLARSTSPRWSTVASGAARPWWSCFDRVWRPCRQRFSWRAAAQRAIDSRACAASRRRASSSLPAEGADRADQPDRAPGGDDREIAQRPGSVAERGAECLRQRSDRRDQRDGREGLGQFAERDERRRRAAARRGTAMLATTSVASGRSVPASSSPRAANAALPTTTVVTRPRTDRRLRTGLPAQDDRQGDQQRRPAPAR